MFDMIYPKQDEGMVTIVYKEGSVFWALEKMIEGKTVSRGYDLHKLECNKVITSSISGKQLPSNSAKEFVLSHISWEDFAVYEKTKLEHGFKAGDWLKSTHPDDQNYYKVIRTYHKGIMPYAKLRGTAIAHWDTPLYETKSDGEYVPLFQLCKMTISIDGTPYWAWKQMAAGKKVHRVESSRIYRMDAWGHAVDSENDYTYTYGGFFMIEHKNDWEIYEEEKPGFKVGDWVKNKNTGKYCQIVGVNPGSKYVMQVRKAGSNTAIMAAVEHYEPASLEPDFTNIKAGDRVFHSTRGYRNVTTPTCSSTELDNGKMYIADGIGGFFSNGTYKYMQDFAEVFEDHYQAKAYFLEMFRKLDEEENDE